METTPRINEILVWF